MFVSDSGLLTKCILIVEVHVVKWADGSPSMLNSHAGAIPSIAHVNGHDVDVVSDHVSVMDSWSSLPRYSCRNA